MKASSFLPALCLALLTLASCSKEPIRDLSEDMPLSITIPEAKGESGGTVDSDTAEPAFTTAYFMYDPEVEGCVWFHAHTNGRMVYNSIFLSMYLKEKSLVVGKKPVIERFSFGLPLSSDSRDYAGLDSGHIYVKERHDNLIVLRFDNALFELAHGTYRLHGDLSFSLKTDLD